MFYSYYDSPIGKLIITSEDGFLTNLNLADHFKNINKYNYNDDELIIKVKRCLDNYFSGQLESFDNINIKINGTSFQMDVLEELRCVKYGDSITYGLLAKIIAKKRGMNKMSAQAIGNAIHNNPICIIVPCHRVLGKNNNLVGYALGLDKKRYLLDIEGVKYGR